jgi:chromosome segregation ATPase
LNTVQKRASMGDILDTPVSLELVLAQLKVKEQYCKELEDSQKSLQQQVQELLQESNVTKSNLSRKERQWEQEEAKLTSQLGVANMELMEKGTLVKQLEKDLGMARSAVEQLQSKSSEAERWKEREVLENQRLQADLADSRLAIEELEKNCSLKDEAVAKQRKLLEDFSKKMEAQKKQLEVTQHFQSPKSKLTWQWRSPADIVTFKQV